MGAQATYSSETSDKQNIDYISILWLLSLAVQLLELEVRPLKLEKRIILGIRSRKSISTGLSPYMFGKKAPLKQLLNLLSL